MISGEVKFRSVVKELQKEELTGGMLTLSTFERLDVQPEEMSEGKLINIKEENDCD